MAMSLPFLRLLRLLICFPSLAAPLWSLEEEETLLAEFSVLQTSSQLNSHPRFDHHVWDAFSPCVSFSCPGIERGQWHQMAWGQVLPSLLENGVCKECVYNACEKPRMFQLVRAPANAFSSLGFVAVGLFALSVTCLDLLHTDAPYGRHGPVILHGILFGTVLVAEGGASFAYHASLTLQMNILDWRTMLVSFAAQGFGLVIASQTLLRRPVSSWLFAILFLAYSFVLLLSLGLSCGCFCSIDEACNSPVWPMVWLATGLFCLSAPLSVEWSAWQCMQELQDSSQLRIVAAARRRFRYLMWSAVALWLVGYSCKLLDDYQIMCRPSSLFQFVALMHLVMAAAMLLSFLATRTCSKLLVVRLEADPIKCQASAQPTRGGLRG
ncbi:unnamed protein product [Symbiodinium sp. CCMP2592]|nr:unnamed protein product [Symbiodinium sp. CCMP2592]